MLRLPAVAGQFYPGTPEKLSLAVRMYTQEKVHEEKVRALAALVPHAGYVYSGGVAGAVFSASSCRRKSCCSEYAIIRAAQRWQFCRRERGGRRSGMCRLIPRWPRG